MSKHGRYCANEIHLEVLEELTKIDEFDLPGHGHMYVVRLDADYVREHDPRQLKSQDVVLDGQVRQVRGIEAFCVPWHAGFPNEALRTSGCWWTSERRGAPDDPVPADRWPHIRE